MSVWQRTWKYVMVMTLSVLIAEWLQLNNVMTAGVIGILTVAETRRSTLRLVGERLVAMLIALICIVLLVHFLGFHGVVLSVFLVIYVPLCMWLHVSTGIVPSVVLVGQLLVVQSVSMESLLNQSVLYIIGSLLAILVNGYMSSHVSEIAENREQIVLQLQRVVLLLSQYLYGEYEGLPWQELNKLEDLIESGKQLVLYEQGNQLFKQMTASLHYVEMRDGQAQLLRQMLETVETTHFDSREGKVLAGLFYLTASQIHVRNSATYIVEDIDILQHEFKQRALPQTREEFEHRATLFQLLNQFRRFILLKVDFYQANEAVILQWETIKR